MIQPTDVARLITESYPAFSERWNEQSYHWPDKGESPSACAVLCEFSHLISEKLGAEDFESIPAVFSLIERMLGEGTQDVMDAAATCFLENIHNRVPTTIAPGSFVPFLGPLSRDYCRAWDKFCGVETKGLH